MTNLQQAISATTLNDPVTAADRLRQAIRQTMATEIQIINPSMLAVAAKLAQSNQPKVNEPAQSTE
jgi:hypothetical protein